MNALPQGGRKNGGHRAHDFSRLANVNAWVFDLDNTLYPHHIKLFGQIDGRIRDYVARLLNLPPDEAQRLQKDYYHRYGTTLRGLMVEHDIQPDGFLEYVHDIDHSPVQPDPRLGAAIAALPGRKFILTNGARSHADKVAARLGITDHFEQIFDIVSSELLPKPNPETYQRFIAATGIDPKRSAMFEDLARNLVVPRALGMATILIVPSGTREVFTEDWEMEGQDSEHIDFVDDNLAGFIEAALVAAKPPPA